MEIGAKPDDAHGRDRFNIPELDLGDFLSGLEAGGGGAGSAAAAAVKKIDILADGIITLAEATEHGISVIQAAALELGHELGEIASRMFRVNVGFEKLNQRTNGRNRLEAMLQTVELELEYQQGLRQTSIELSRLNDILSDTGLIGNIGTFRHVLLVLGEGFRTAEESIIQFLHRLTKASVDAVQTRFNALFNQPTREQAESNLRLAILQAQRARLFQGGGTEEQLAALLKPLDLEISAIEATTRVRSAEFDVIKSINTLADQTLLTDKELLSQSLLLTGMLVGETSLLKDINEQLFLEKVQLLGVNEVLGGFEAALRDARDLLQDLALTGGRQLNVTTVVNADLDDIVELVAETTRQGLRDAGLGGSISGSGAFVT